MCLRAGRPTTVAPNTVLDVERYQRDLAALTPGAAFTPLNLNRHRPALRQWVSADVDAGSGAAVWKADGGCGVCGDGFGEAAAALSRRTDTRGLGRNSRGIRSSTATAMRWAGFGTEQEIVATAHSSYHALQTSLSGPLPHGGPGVQISYTWAKSIDDTSGVVGGGGTGAVSNTSPQNPFDNHPEKGPSGFDVTHGFTASLAQDLQLEKVEWLEPVSRRFTAGWELLSISTISSGLPFTIYSGVQQTGAGAGGVDRPDQIAKPQLSTARKVREDYFGKGVDNASFFSIPISSKTVTLPGGTGPNQGYFGTLGRNTFRGPAFYDFDFSLIKDTPVGRRAAGGELMDVQFRSEFFNLFNIVDFGPAGEYDQGVGVWGDQQDGGIVAADTVFFEGAVLMYPDSGLDLIDWGRGVP
jgi:hypothetical protein